MRTQSIAERLRGKIKFTADCWEWIAALDSNGYGQFPRNGTSTTAHRVVYEYLVGPIPDGLHLDHLCRNRSCVRPDHLEPVTTQENIRRGEVGKRHRDKTQCPRGHAYDNANTYHYLTPRGTPARQCRTCKVDAVRRFRERVSL